MFIKMLNYSLKMIGEMQLCREASGLCCVKPINFNPPLLFVIDFEDSCSGSSSTSGLVFTLSLISSWDLLSTCLLLFKSAVYGLR